MKISHIEVEGERFAVHVLRNKTVICKPVKVYQRLDKDYNALYTIKYMPFKEVKNQRSKYQPHQGTKEKAKRERSKSQIKV